MSKTREPGQGAAGSLPAISDIYAPPTAPLDSRLLQPTIPISLLLSFTLAVALLFLSLLSWLLMGFAHFFPMVATLGTGVEGWIIVGYLNLLGTPLLVGTLFAPGLGMAVWQGCSFASLRRAYGDNMVSRGWSSCIWWLVPIADLFMPLRCLRDLRYLIEKPREKPDPRAPFGKTLVILESLLITDFLIDVVTLLVEEFSESPDEAGISDEEAMETLVTSATAITPERILNLATSSIGAALTIVMLVIVISYFFRQKELYAHWQDDLHWESRERLRKRQA